MIVMFFYERSKITIPYLCAKRKCKSRGVYAQWCNSANTNFYACLNEGDDKMIDSWSVAWSTLYWWFTANQPYPSEHISSFFASVSWYYSRSWCKESTCSWWREVRMSTLFWKLESIDFDWFMRVSGVFTCERKVWKVSCEAHGRRCEISLSVWWNTTFFFSRVNSWYTM